MSKESVHFQRNILTSAIFFSNSISIESRCAEFTSSSKCIVETQDTFTTYGVTTAWFRGIDIAATLAGLTCTAKSLWTSIKS